MKLIGTLIATAIFCINVTAQQTSDKTLVSWLTLDNLSQQGGSALTIQQGDEFDAIVFGEINSGKWMAGSNNFSRTDKEQDDWITETANINVLIQIAIVYEDDQISIYRNGKLYSSYESNNIDFLHTDYNLVVFGLRHIGAGGGYFSGAIEDARIYDFALSLSDIKSLKPNEMSELKPYAWWDFEGDEMKDLTGRFSHHRMKDGAKLSGGKLILGEASVAVATHSDEEAINATQGKTPLAPMPPWLGETPAMPKEIPENWLSYHLAHPGPGKAFPGDPNCAFYYKGLYHLHYIYINRHGFAFAHVSSKDMVTWKWHPTKLVPPITGHGMYSGTGFFTKEGKPAIIYHGQGSEKNFISFAEDDMLDVWSKPMPIEPKTASGADVETRQWDPDCWLNGETYYAISGGAPPHLIKSDDLKSWTSLDLLLHEDMPDLGVSRDEDVSCANMFKIGDKWMLLCISHALGCRYYLGDFKDEKYLPEFHAMMNWNGWDFFAPESMLTKDGRRVMWAWCLLDGAQSGIQSLPRELSLPKDGILRIKPLRELEKLRFDPIIEKDITVSKDQIHVLQSKGDILELNIMIKANQATEYGVNVFCDEEGEGLPISINPNKKAMLLGDKEVPFELKQGEDLNIRIFLDHAMVEVFLNDRQAANLMHIHEKDNVGISLFTIGDGIKAQVNSWKMKSIYEN